MKFFLIFDVGTIRELSVFEEGQVATYPYKRKKQAKIVKYREVFCEKYFPQPRSGEIIVASDFLISPSYRTRSVRKFFGKLKLNWRLSNLASQGSALPLQIKVDAIDPYKKK